MNTNKTFHRGLSFFMAVAMVVSMAACGTAPKDDNEAAKLAPVITETVKESEEKKEETTKDSNIGKKDELRELRMDALSNCGMPAPFISSPKGSGYAVVQYVFDTLVWKDVNGYMNLLAESYSVSDDNKVYRFKLRDGVTWHDGQPFTSDDVKFSFDYYAQHEYSWVSVSKVKEVRVIDEKTVEVELNDVYVPFISDVAASLPMIPKHIYENVDDPATYKEKDAFIGTGPMMVESCNTETGVYTYVKNPDYFFGDVQVDRLILSPYEDAKTALLNGEIDATTTSNYKQVLSLKDTENINVIEGSSMWVSRLYFNFDNQALAKKEVRQAIAYSIDRKEITEKAFKGAGVPGNDNYVLPDSTWLNSNVKSREKDVAKAKELLTAIGAVDSDNDNVLEYEGQKLSFELLISEKDQRLAELLKAYLAETGIEVTVKAADDATVKSLIQEGNFTIAANGHGAFGGDPKYLAALASDTTGAAKITVQGGHRWENSQYNELMEQSLVELDQKKREALVNQMQEIIADEVPTLAIYYKSNASAYNTTTFDGFYYTPDGISSGVPYIYNKLILVSGTWNK